MCFELGSCFGSGRREDFGGERPAHKPTHGRGGNRGNDAYYGGGGAMDDKAPTAATYHHQPYAAADEAGQKAYHDGARKDHQADVAGHGRYAAYVHDMQADHGTPKLPPWHNKAGDVAGYAFTARLHDEAAANRRVNAAVDYNHYPTTTANTTLAR